MQIYVYHNKDRKVISTGIYLKPIVDKRYQTRGEFVHISSDMMVYLYGRTFYGTILKALLQYKFIDKSKKNYKVGERTNAYRISAEYLGFKFVTLKCNTKLAKKHYAIQEQKNKENITNQKVYDKLKATFHTITINFQEANQYLLDQLIHSLENPDTIKLKEHQYFIKGVFKPKVVGRKTQ